MKCITFTKDYMCVVALLLFFSLDLVILLQNLFGVHLVNGG